MAKEAIIIAGVIVAGAAIAGSLFLLFPDVMFKNTGFESQGGASTDVPVMIDETTTAGNSTNSTANANATGAPATTVPPY